MICAIKMRTQLVSLSGGNTAFRESGTGKSRENCVARTENMNDGSHDGHYDRTSAGRERKTLPAASGDRSGNPWRVKQSTKC